MRATEILIVVIDRPTKTRHTFTSWKKACAFTRAGNQGVGSGRLRRYIRAYRLCREPVIT